MGSRVVSASAYVDRVNHDSVGGSGVMDMKAEQGMALVADPVTGTFQLATGSYAGRGVSVSLEQSLTPVLAASVQYDLGTAMEREQDLATLAEAAAELHAQTAQAVTVVLHGKVDAFRHDDARGVPLAAAGDPDAGECLQRRSK